MRDVEWAGAMLYGKTLVKKAAENEKLRGDIRGISKELSEIPGTAGEMVGSGDIRGAIAPTRLGGSMTAALESARGAAIDNRLAVLCACTD